MAANLVGGGEIQRSGGWRASGKCMKKSDATSVNTEGEFTVCGCFSRDSATGSDTMERTYAFVFLLGDIDLLQ